MDEALKKRSQEIQEALSSALSESLGIPVIKVNADLIEAIFNHVKGLPEIKDRLSESDLHQEISSFVSMSTAFPAKDKEELEQRISEFLSSLEEEKQYESLFFIPGLIDLPLGTQLGPLEIIAKPVEDTQLFEYFDAVSEHKRLNLEHGAFARATFSSYKTQGAYEMLSNELELPFAIISLVADFPFDLRLCTGLIRIVKSDISNKWFFSSVFFEPQREQFGWTKLNLDRQGDLLDRLSEISLDARPSNLKKKILQSLQVYGLSRFAQKTEIRFLLLISSFESLLLTENDRDYLGKKLAEKTSFLLEDSYDARISLYRSMKKYYSQRSILVHQGIADVSRNNLEYLEYLFRSLVLKLLQLTETYEKMEQKSHEKDQEGVEDLIHTIRFS